MPLKSILGVGGRVGWNGREGPGAGEVELAGAGLERLTSRKRAKRQETRWGGLCCALRCWGGPRRRGNNGAVSAMARAPQGAATRARCILVRLNTNCAERGQIRVALVDDGAQRRLQCVDRERIGGAGSAGAVLPGFLG